MKETKVYVDKMPESCSKCFLCYDNRPYWKSTDCILLRKELDEDEIETSRDKDCPLIDIKTHDRELVKEVCEKIRSELEKELKYDFTSYVPIMNVCNKINRVLDQTQKDIENG